MVATETPAETPATVTGNTAENGTENAATVPGTATGTDTRPAPNQIAGAVWLALTDNPGATAVTLATKAGVAKATARRALKELETAGYAARTTGGRDGGKRTADTWNAISTQPAPEAASDTGRSDADTDDLGDGTGGTAAENAFSEVDGATGDGDEAQERMDEAAVTEAGQALTALTVVITSAVAALDAGDRVAALTAAESIYGDSAKVRRLIKIAANHRPCSTSGKPRSHPGEMRAKVAAHLAAHPDSQFTPHEVGKVIGHSAGAVANALDKLTELGEAALTCDRPRRFSAPDTATTTVSKAATTA